MESVRSQFQRELENLELLISFFDEELNLLKIPQNEHPKLDEFINLFSAFYSQKRIFNYNSLIISLYGYFEKFIENLLIAYIDNINGYFKRYSSIPHVLTKNHLKLSLSLLDKVENPRYNGPLNKEGIIENLHKCININENYQLNKEAFSQHTANFRIQVVDEIFGRIGIDSISNKLKGNAEFQAYIKEKYEIEIIGDLDNDDIHSIMNELAERRNEVAHGVPSEILSNQIILDYFNYFKKIAHAITEVVLLHSNRININENGQLINELTDCYKGGTILCFNTNFQKLNKGDYIFGVNDSSIVKAKILNIQLEDIDIESTDESQDYEIGVLIDKPFKKNHKVYK
ncbi:MAG: hypothetical protein RIS29_2387 [Bacteroidota bacterium]|jgi:hypothetical protein